MARLPPTQDDYEQLQNVFREAIVDAFNERENGGSEDQRTDLRDALGRVASAMRKFADLLAADSPDSTFAEMVREGGDYFAKIDEGEASGATAGLLYGFMVGSGLEYSLNFESAESLRRLTAEKQSRLQASITSRMSTLQRRMAKVKKAWEVGFARTKTLTAADRYAAEATKDDTGTPLSERTIARYRKANWNANTYKSMAQSQAKDAW